VNVTAAVSEGALLLRIPEQCLVTLSAAESSAAGKKIFKAVSIVKAKLHNSSNDVALAMFLAFEMNAGSRFKDYAATLPPRASYNGLPRRWSDKKLARLLTGSPLLERTRRDREGLRQDYDLVASRWKSVDVALPSLEHFDQALAAVSSRAFAGLGGDELDAMVPLLDLLDHRRGVGQAKDTQYKRAADGAVEVRAQRALAAGSAVYLTYGAKGNAQLLSCYGFCLRRNVEPDGSSNDVLEFTLPGATVALRAGPKAYTYGPFVKAIEMLRATQRKSVPSPAGGLSAEAADMDQFLDEMDDMDGMCDLDGEDEGGEEEEKEDDEEEEGDDNHGEDGHANSDAATAAERKALEAFASALEATSGRYSLRGAALAEALQECAPPHDRFTAMLVASEQRTIDLFSEAVRLALEALATQHGATAEKKRKLSGNDDDARMLRSQAEELVSAYMKIRHPSR